jgi:hypothetical protein
MSTTSTEAPFGYGRVNNDGLCGANLVKHAFPGTPYRMLFANGEMVVHGYPLHNAKQTVLYIPFLPENVFLPKTRTLHWLNVALRDAGLQCGKKVYSVLVTSTRHYGLPARPVLYGPYTSCIERIATKLLAATPDGEWLRRNAGGKQTYGYRAIKNVYRDRAIQVLHFHAHTIQLLFRRMVEKKRLNRCLVLEFLLEQQGENHYLQNELVMRDVFTFCK